MQLQTHALASIHTCTRTWRHTAVVRSGYWHRQAHLFWGHTSSFTAINKAIDTSYTHSSSYWCTVYTYEFLYIDVINKMPVVEHRCYTCTSAVCTVHCTFCQSQSPVTPLHQGRSHTEWNIHSSACEAGSPSREPPNTTCNVIHDEKA